ncbi:MAG: DUF1350 family protein [Oscillatoriales cyanobacterium C42_A2020_001]|nr:DUF1350 family protein [Leptolyngbyaceae cyanobacterium C42_A2020_001]
MDWQELYGNWVLVPDRPIAVIHFLGGAFVATAPQVTYRRLLERLALEGYAIVATPFVNTFDHNAIAQTVYRNFNRALETLFETRFRQRYLPIYGMGHSMGCKLHLLIGSQFEVERSGNILISFNNYAARDAVPLVEQVSSVFSQFSSLFSSATPAFDVEFTPSPIETTRIISKSYQVKRNLLIQFTNDTIDQTRGLTDVLQNLFPGMVVAQTLSGTHLTPLGPDIKWQVGDSFAPWDAIAQWMRQEVYRDLHQLERNILRWLNPFSRN